MVTLFVIINVLDNAIVFGNEPQLKPIIALLDADSIVSFNALIQLLLLMQ